MINYSELDEMILSKITEQPKSFSDIYFPDIYPKCKEFCIGRQEPARVLDRRLQALRKKGLIYFSRGWRKVKNEGA